MTINESFGIIIFGASGDLALKKLFPAIFSLYSKKHFKSKFYILGTGRTKFENDVFKKRIKNFLVNENKENNEHIDSFLKNINYVSINPFVEDDYNKLVTLIKDYNAKFNFAENLLFYLATPPSLYSIISKNLFYHNLNNENKGWKRIIIEKPFGHNFNSAVELNNELLKYFKEEQLYRIDHYLGKETVQNILVTRFSNTIFEPVWNRNYIHHIEITAAEDQGIEGRAGYYDNYGALRDMVQNHLMQLMALIAMEPPSEISSGSIRNETLKVFQSLLPLQENEIEKYVVRGQYSANTIRNNNIKGYRQEEGILPDSKTETYVAIKCYIENWRWNGIPFYIRTGKRLPTRVTEVVIHFKFPPHKMFCNSEKYNANQLIIRIQPDEGILLKFGLKVPGMGFKVKTVDMDFHYKELSDITLPSAYERLLLDCLQGDSTLYIRNDALEATWKYIDPILRAWSENKKIPLYSYPAGTWGPVASNNLFEDSNITWRYPCKNLSNDNYYCEL